MYGTGDVPVKAGLIFHLKAEHGTPTNWRAARGSATVAVPTGVPSAFTVSGRRAIVTSTGVSYEFQVAPPFTDGAVSVYAIVGRNNANAANFGASLNSSKANRAEFKTWRDSDGRCAIYTDDVNSRSRSGATTGTGSTGTIVQVSLIYRGPVIQTHYFGSNGVEIADQSSPDLSALASGPKILFRVGGFAGIYIYEILIYTGAHDATTRQRVEQYLRFRREGRI